MVHNKIFCTVINCMDGRCQDTVNAFMEEKFGADYVDEITEAGPVKHLLRETKISQSIKQRTEISVKKHGSNIIAVVAHTDCAGNPKTRREQEKELKHSVKKIQEWHPKAKVVGLWLGRNWKPELIT